MLQLLVASSLRALGSSHSFTYHATQRGQFHANLFREPVPLPSLTDALEFDVKMPNVDVVLGPGGQDPVNPYICGIFDLRKLTPGRDYTNSKVHIGKMSALLHGPSEEYVHHIILYSCNEEAAAGFTHNSLVCMLGELFHLVARTWLILFFAYFWAAFCRVRCCHQVQIFFFWRGGRVHMQ